MTPDEALTDEARFFARSLITVDPKIADQMNANVRAYRSRVGRDLQCPRCWVKDGARSALRSVPGTDDYDVLRCNYAGCGAEFIVPF